MPVPDRQVKMNRGLILKLSRLLNMLYKPRELAAELGVSAETVYRRYIPAGAPVVVDGQGVKWINGKHFATWAREVLETDRRGRLARTMSETHGFCMRCNQVVEMIDARRRPHSLKAGTLQVSGKCPVCGAKVNRFVKAG